jgi:hypothetical protein|tara:strand:+ start:739 stop:1248 length:510 start_codon:yes stop_codon:yes gene_type:complete
MKLSRTLSVFIFCIIFSGCASRFDDVATLGDEIKTINGQPLEVASAYLANKTIRTFTGFHGNQIEYFSPKGRAFLWYPGNRGTVRSLWMLRQKDGRYDICFKYPTNSYNPATKDYGGNWECQDLAIYARRVVEVSDADIFRLSTGRVPFRLEPSDLNFYDLKNIAGIKQ